MNVIGNDIRPLTLAETIYASLLLRILLYDEVKIIANKPGLLAAYARYKETLEKIHRDNPSWQGQAH